MAEITSTVDAWLAPLDSEAGPCGPDLEYDNDFLTLSQTAAGKPETQFDAAVPPDWRAVRQQAEALFERTRDLRVAVLWLRALLNLEGIATLPETLRLLHGLLENFWDTLNPLPDDGDCYARMNALADLREPAAALGDLRNAVLFSARGFGDIRVRAIEVALGHVAPRDGEDALGRDQLSQMLSVAASQQSDLRTLPSRSLAQVRQLASLVEAHVGSVEAPDLRPLQSLLHHVGTLMPDEAADSPADDGAAADASAHAGADAGLPGEPARSAVRGLSGGVHSREDALRAIDMVCDFLERTEPTNPAQLLLRRARRMVNHNFLQLMKELAPEALGEVARIMGVDPDSVSLDDA